MASRRWRKLKTSGPMPVELASHSTLLHGNHLVLFGGTGVPFGEAASNQLYVCNLPTLQWTHVVCTGHFPICIYGHTMTVLGNSLYVFGGTTGWEYNSDLHQLDLQSFVWDLVDVSGVRPDGRYRHEAACVGSEMFVFGGGRSTEVCILQCVCCADVVCAGRLGLHVCALKLSRSTSYPFWGCPDVHKFPEGIKPVTSPILGMFNNFGIQSLCSTEPNYI